MFGFVWWLNCESGERVFCLVLYCGGGHTGKQDAEECVSRENDLRVKFCVALRTNVRYNKIIVNALNSWGKT